MKANIKFVVGTVEMEIPEEGIDYKLPAGPEYVILTDAGAFGVAAAPLERKINIDKDGNVTVGEVLDG